MVFLTLDIYADEGISGTNVKKRKEFQRMIADCEAKKIDLVIVKSISRFARNTQDCLTYSRKLKNLGIGIIFEKYITIRFSGGKLDFSPQGFPLLTARIRPNLLIHSVNLRNWTGVPLLQIMGWKNWNMCL